MSAKKGSRSQSVAAEAMMEVIAPFTSPSQTVGMPSPVNSPNTKQEAMPAMSRMGPQQVEAIAERSFSRAHSSIAAFSAAVLYRDSSSTQISQSRRYSATVSSREARLVSRIRR